MNHPAAYQSRSQERFRSSFLPASLTPLHYAPKNLPLTDEQKIRYNQLFGLYINELLIFFETKYAKAYAPLLTSPLLSHSVKQEVQKFLDDEDRHWRMFADFNRKAAPELYDKNLFYFVQPPRFSSFIARQMMRYPRLFIFIPLLVFIQEDRAQFIAHKILHSDEVLDPRFVAVHQAHAEDEKNHICFGEKVLTHLWNDLNLPLRKLNVALLCFCLREFFTLPKRSGMRILNRFLEEYPELASEKETLRDYLFLAVTQTKFHDTLYSLEALPSCMNFFSKSPEFRAVCNILLGNTANQTEV